jgi:hypothetical protein
MTKLKCPFCQQELRKDSDGFYTCYTDNCGCMKYGGNGASGSESLWLALIHTRKALDVAVDALRKIGFGKNINIIPDDESAKYINLSVEALDQIQELDKGE